MVRRRIVVSAVGLACWLASSQAGAASGSSQLLVNIPKSAVVSSTDPAQSARRLLVQHAAIPSHVVLTDDRRLTVGGATIYRFKQTHLGVPVYARGAGIAVDSKGAVILATSKVAEHLPNSVTPSISAAAAAALATKATDSAASESDATLVIAPMPRGAPNLAPSTDLLHTRR